MRRIAWVDRGIAAGPIESIRHVEEALVRLAQRVAGDQRCKRDTVAHIQDAGKLPATPAAAPADSETSSDPTTQMLKQLQDQLRQIMDQIKRLQASSVSDEQKMPMLQSLNAEAATIQGQIEALMQKQMQAASGTVTA